MRVKGLKFNLFEHMRKTTLIKGEAWNVNEHYFKPEAAPNDPELV